MAFELVTTPAQLETALQDLQGSHELALDLEFDNNLHTYGLTLCLIQVATRHSCYLIDPIALHGAEALWPLLENPAITKILHSGSQDIMLLRTLGCQPRNLADTEVAARILNHSRPSFSTLLTEKLGIMIDKAQQASNWTKRPLSDAQLDYASKDVLFLHTLYDVMLSEVRAAGRESWLQEEGRLLEKVQFREVAEPQLRLKDTSRLSAWHQHVLKRLYQLRDSWARRFNQPPGRILPNELLVRLVQEPVVSLEAWSKTQGVFGPIRTEKHFERYQHAYQESVAEADELQLSRHASYPLRAPLLVSMQESGRRKQLLSRVRELIVEKYGATTTELIITTGMIKQCALGHPLVVVKQFAYQIIQEAIAHLQLPDLDYLVQLADPAVQPVADELAATE